MSISSLDIPTKACHNCRRRRWKCDRSLPVCQKCLSSGAECLGYGKLYVWADNSASRAKPSGVAQANRKSLKEKDARSERFPPPNSQGQLGAINLEQNEGNDVCKELVPRMDGDARLHRPLTDPLVQDLDQHSRYYMHHWATNLCGDMVLYDTPAQNPMRELASATSASPLLLQIILATSAFHVFNISGDPVGPSSYQPENKPCLVDYYKTVSRYGGPSKTSYKDALIAKQQALTLLAKSVATVNQGNIDLILVTILLFVNYDLIESGEHNWKVHMEGARRLIHLLGTPPYQSQAMSKMRMHVLADFIIFYILGSLFSSSPPPNLIPSTIDIDLILRYAENNNYLSCPAPLLKIMLHSFKLPSIQPNTLPSTETQAQLKMLLETALDFDPSNWLETFDPAPPSEDLRQRFHIGSAHRAGVCIYLARHLPLSHPLIDPSSPSRLVNLDELAKNIVYSVSQIPSKSPLFKSICWPLFLAGAETDDAEQRIWIMNTMDELYHNMYWGYIRTGKKTLESIWAKRDAVKGGGEVPCWVDNVKDMGSEILIA